MWRLAAIIAAIAAVGSGGAIAALLATGQIGKSASTTPGSPTTIPVKILPKADPRLDANCTPEPNLADHCTQGSDIVVQPPMLGEPCTREDGSDGNWQEIQYDPNHRRCGPPPKY